MLRVTRCLLYFNKNDAQCAAQPDQSEVVPLPKRLPHVPVAASYRKVLYKVCSLPPRRLLAIQSLAIY
jgi:hypothetical protein